MRIGWRLPLCSRRAAPGLAPVATAQTVAVLPALLADTTLSASPCSTATVWAVATGAKPGASRLQQRGKRHPMRITDYTRGGRTAVTLCEIAGLGHAWSGGAASMHFSDAAGPDASKLVWAFAARQFRETALRS